MTVRMFPINGAFTSASVPPPPALPAQRSYSAAGAIATNASTATSSAVLNFGANNVPSWILLGMKASDLTTPSAITGGQTVTNINAAAGTVTLSGNVNATVGAGDQLSFGSAFIDAPGDMSGDAATLGSGFVAIGTSGPTSSRPPSTKAGAWHVDTTLGFAVAFDGLAWRHPVSGLAV